MILSANGGISLCTSSEDRSSLRSISQCLQIIEDGRDNLAYDLCMLDEEYDMADGGKRGERSVGADPRIVVCRPARRKHFLYKFGLEYGFHERGA